MGCPVGCRLGFEEGLAVVGQLVGRRFFVGLIEGWLVGVEG